jgi:hypothetical protein
MMVNRSCSGSDSRKRFFSTVGTGNSFQSTSGCLEAAEEMSLLSRFKRFEVRVQASSEWPNGMTTNEG